MTDITIPAEAARAAAVILRLAAIKGGAYKSPAGVVYRAADLADILDPPAPSLRDELAAAIIAAYSYTDTGSDRILAVVRRHVEALPLPDQPGLPVAWGNGWLAGLEDVRRLLGGSDE